MDLIEYFRKRKLLTDGKSNTKTAKNSMHTYYLSLQPTNLNSKGENLCKFSTKECRTACLQFAGRQSFDNVVQSRSKKTEFYVNHKNLFINKLWNELVELNHKVIQKDPFNPKKIAIRLNLLSDIDWDSEFLRVNDKYDMETLQYIQFYDYTKDHMKVYSDRLSNYHLTFSYSGHNWVHAEIFLKDKIANVAVVFKNTLPLVWRGYNVADGDKSDERFLEQKGIIIGLKYKTPKGVKYAKNKFIVDESTSSVRV